MASINGRELDVVGTQELTPSVPTICLHVVSPGPENRHTFSSLPLTTTIGELKLLIAASISGRPGPERQRLIYRGRRLAMDTDTLADVVGQVEANDNTPAPAFTIHLVLPPASPVQGPGLPPPHPYSPNPQLPQPPTPPLAQPLQQAQNMTQFNSSTFVNGAQIPMPPEMQNAIRGAMAAHEEAIRRILPQQMQNLAGTPQPQSGVLQPNQPSLQNAVSALDRHVQGLQHDIAQRRQQPQQNPNQVQITRTAQTTVVYSSQSQDRNTQGGNVRNDVRMSFSHTQVMRDPAMEATLVSNPYATRGRDLIEDPVTENTPQREQFRQDLRSIQQRLTVLERELLTIPRRTQHIPSNQDVQQLLLELGEACQKSHVSPEDPFASDVRRRINQLTITRSSRILDEIRRNANAPASPTSVPLPSLNSSLAPATPNAIPSPGMTPTPTTNPSVISTSANSAATNPTVYLLSSPTGPHGLVFTRNGTPTTAVSRGGSRGSQVQRSGRSANARLRAAVRGRGNAVEQARNIAQARRTQRQNLAAIASSVWLLVRLFFFFWLFGIGGSWTRMILVVAGGTVVFLAHVGLFAPLREWWNPIREHLEALIPLAADNNQNQQQPVPAGPQQDGAQTQRAGEPDPQEAAHRLLREQQARGGNWIRGSLRRLERAVALFMATLVPGVGERHIQARNAAEAARLAEQRRQEEERRQQEQAADQGEPQPREDNRSDVATRGSGSSEDASVSAPDTNDQPPAQVEIHG